MASDSSGTVVRPYNPSTDEPALVHICQETLPTSLKPTSAWALGPYIWALPYARLVPSYCFVLDSGLSNSSPSTSQSNSVVGYILGTPSLATFLSTYDSKFLSSLSTTAAADKSGHSIPLFPPPPKEPLAGWGEDLQTCLRQRIYDPATAGDLTHADFPSLLQRYPAHLHIDILPEFQGKGYGRVLMETFLQRLREADGAGGGKGVHLIMDGQNFGAEKFYLKLGFGRFDVVLDNGASGEKGRHSDGTVWMVRGL